MHGETVKSPLYTLKN